MKYRFSISRKLTLGFGLYSLCVVALFIYTDTTLNKSRAINERINTIYAPSIRLLEQLDYQLLKAQEVMTQWAKIQGRPEDQDRTEVLGLCTQDIPLQVNRIDSISVGWTDNQNVDKNVLIADIQTLLLVYKAVRDLLPTFDSYNSPFPQMEAEDVFFIEDEPLIAYNRARTNVRELIQSQRSDMETEIGRMNASFSDLTQIFIWVASSVILIGIFLAFITIQSIVRPVNSLRH